MKKMKKTNPETYNSQIIDALFDEITPIEQEKIDKRMLLAAKIQDAIKAKGWKNKDFLEALGKDNPSIITKWLSGTHNFTTDTLVEIEHALGIRLLNLEEPKEQTIIEYHLVITQKAHLSIPTYINHIIDARRGQSVVVKSVPSKSGYKYYAEA
jgi:transcriptional regulator with XRE-family HTH domain